MSATFGEITRSQKAKIEGTQRNMINYIFRRSQMTEEEEPDASIAIAQNSSTEEEEEFYSQHLDTQEQPANQKNRKKFIEKCGNVSVLYESPPN